MRGAAVEAGAGGMMEVQFDSYAHQHRTKGWDSRTSTGQMTGVRWIARLTDFVRTTTTAGQRSLGERVLGGLGLTPSQPQRPQQQHQQTPAAG